MEAFDVLVVGFGSKFRDPLGFKRRGAQDGTCLACAGVCCGGEHTPVSVLQDFVPEGAAAAPAHLTYIMLYTCIFPLTYSTNKKGSPRHSS